MMSVMSRADVIERAGLAAAAAAALALAVPTVRALRRHADAVRRVAPELRSTALLRPSTVSNRALLAHRRHRRPATAALPPGVQRHGVRLARAGGPELELDLYSPTTRPAPTGALVWMHGGGLVMGTTRHADAWCARVADELGVLVVSVGYRLAPDHPYPAAIDDCHDALTWVHREASGLGVDTARVAIGGDSAGGGLAASLAQRAHDTGLPVRLQVLVYPMLDDRTVTRVRAERTWAVLWTPPSNRFGWSSYLGHAPGEDETRPYAVPARRPDLAGLAPAWIGVGSLDLFHDEDVAYAERLRAAGVPVDLHVVPGMYHAADDVVPDAPQSVRLRGSALAALADALRDPAPGPTDDRASVSEQ
ncbi:Putative esterase LipW OS=Cellulomonas persica OX=76861 GN=CPE01_16020 PE=4 SV=1 [Cellulomonas persica]